MVVGLVVGLLVAFASAPASARPPQRQLHERPPTAHIRGRSDAAVGRPVASGALPSAIDTAAGRIEAPAARGAGEQGGDDGAPLYPAPPEPGSTPPPRIRPDVATGKEGALHYRVVFDPSVAPFKRDLAFDRAEPDGSLAMSAEGRTTMTPRGTKGRVGHELFWGHVTLDLVPGRHTPLPSVSPSSEILGVAVDPPVALAIQRDAAGNFSVSAARAGRVELRYLMDAPSTYFSAPLAAGRISDDPIIAPLAAALQASMASLWPTLGVDPRADRKTNVDALTAWFRAFTPGPGPDPGSPLGPGLVAELIAKQRGICRHRAHGFVLMAWSLRIPAHFVMNDAHAFVEVWVLQRDGRGGWLRIDLGGGAESLELHGAEDHHLHRPLYPDTLPRPPSYTSELSGQRLGDARPASDAAGGGRDGGWAGAQKVIGADGFRDTKAIAKSGQEARNSADSARDGSSDGGGAGALPDRAWLAARAATMAAPSTPPLVTAAVGAGVGTSDGHRLATEVVLSAVAPVAYVGEALEVRGKLTLPEGSRASGLPIEVWLIEPRDGHSGVRIGHAVTAAGGVFKASVAMPNDARLGVFDLVVRFAGDTRLAPSFSRD